MGCSDLEFPSVISQFPPESGRSAPWKQSSPAMVDCWRLIIYPACFMGHHTNKSCQCLLILSLPPHCCALPRICDGATDDSESPRFTAQYGPESPLEKREKEEKGGEKAGVQAVLSRRLRLDSAGERGTICCGAATSQRSTMEQCSPAGFQMGRPAVSPPVSEDRDCHVYVQIPMQIKKVAVIDRLPPRATVWQSPPRTVSSSTPASEP